MAHLAGAYVLVDGAQAVPHFTCRRTIASMSTSTSSPDINSMAPQAWECSGRGLLNEMPPYQGGGDMIAHVTFEKTTYNVLPLKFEAGTPMITEVMGLGAAIDYIESVGRPAIYNHEMDLLHYATARLAEVPRLRIIGTAPHKGAIISFVVEGAHHLDVGTFLDLKGVAVRTGHHCAQPTMQRYNVPGTVRASFGVYNTRTEIDVFVEAMKDIVKKF